MNSCVVGGLHVRIGIDGVRTAAPSYASNPEINPPAGTPLR
jgi:hypothetical protein